jgi:tetratricopeptide (TPR) repeat protein
MDAQQPESKRLRRDVEWALRRALDPSDVLPLLHRLARTAPEGSDESVFAHRQLAELLVERHPWRAALHARRALAARPDDDRACAVLALCQTMLGNYRFAVSAYHRALMCAPKNPWYAHNLGHLLDVALARPNDALFWLRTAYAGAAQNAEIVSSFSHALARAGKLAEAKRVLARAMKRGASREQLALWKWLEKGAPAEEDSPRPRPSPMASTPSSLPGSFDASLDASGQPTAPSQLRGFSAESLRDRAPRSSDGALTEPLGARRTRGRPRSALEAALARGLASLPLDAKQRARARELARDFAISHPTAERPAPLGTVGPGEQGDVGALAGAIAYAIVYVDHVPLTQAEVAACFRVSAASVRGRFKRLRAQLDLTPGDARYATPRLR